MFHYDLIRRGDAHAFNGKPCQDAIATHTYADVICTALADGVSASRYGGEAAKELTSVVAIEFAKYFDRYWEQTDDQLRNEVINQVRAVQRNLSQVCANRGETVYLYDLASTLIVVAYKKRTRQHIAINLGDGAILARPAGKWEAEMLLPPVQLDMGGRMLPVVTAYEAPVMYQYIGIHRGQGAYDAFMLTSDGMEGVFFSHENDDISPSVDELFHNLVVDRDGVNKYFPAAINSLEREDDVSISILVHRPPVVETFMDHDKGVVPDKLKRKARQYSLFGTELYRGNDKKNACRKAGLSYRDEREWRKTQARLKAVGFDD